MAIKDCFIKEWVGYQYLRSCLSRDAIRAVEDAVMKAFESRAPEGLALMVNNGSQYIAQKFRSSMKLLRISLEYIQKHTPEDNGNIESFHSSLKTDYARTYEFQDYREASFAIENAFTDYNEKRLHSSLDHLPPGEFRRKFLNDQSFREPYTRKLEVKINEK